MENIHPSDTRNLAIIAYRQTRLHVCSVRELLTDDFE